MKNKDILILLIIVILGIIFRIWGFSGTNFSNVDRLLPTFNSNSDVFNIVISNSLSPLYRIYLKLWTFLPAIFAPVTKYAAILPSIGSIFVMYFCLKEYLLKKNTELSALVAAGVCAISAMLICLSKSAGMLSFAFMLSGLVLLYSLKVFNNPSKKNCLLLATYSVLLILDHTLSVIFVLFNACALIAFGHQKKKESSPVNNIIAAVILLLPFVPFLMSLFMHPRYFVLWRDNYGWSKLLYGVTDLFSPVLNNVFQAKENFMTQLSSVNSLNFGFIIFAIVPAFIAIYCLIAAFYNARRVNWYILSVILTTFFTILLAVLCGKILFLTAYLTEIYPLAILLVAVGFAGLKSKGAKISLATVYCVVTLFYITVTKISGITLASFL